MKTITLAAGTTHVPFNEVAHLIAYAIHPDIDDEDDNPSSYHFALIGLETELKRAAKLGQLPVKNKLTLGAHELPISNALNHVLVTVDDLRAFVADRGIKVAVEATEPQATELKAKPQISRAPAPITPLTWSNHIQAIATVTPSPKWDKWRHMRDIEIWEAVALSLNLEPDKLPVYLGAYDKLGDDPFRICPRPFLERLQVVNSNCGITFSFKPVHDLKARCLVDLPKSSAWVVKQNMANIPPEIVAMGAMQQHEKSEKARKQTKELNAMRMPGAGGMPISSQWLDSDCSVDISAYKVELEQSISEAPNVAKPKQRVQELRILELLILKKYDPLKLPFRVPGKGGAKAEIRKLALSEPAIFTAKTFDTAWQRLRDDGSIGDA